MLTRHIVNDISLNVIFNMITLQQLAAQAALQQPMHSVLQPQQPATSSAAAAAGQQQDATTTLHQQILQQHFAQQQHAQQQQQQQQQPGAAGFTPQHQHLLQVCERNDGKILKSPEIVRKILFRLLH